MKKRIKLNINPNQKQPSKSFCEKTILKNFAAFTREYLCWSPCKFIKKRLQHLYFPVNSAKFLWGAILKNNCERLLLPNIDVHDIENKELTKLNNTILILLKFFLENLFVDKKAILFIFFLINPVWTPEGNYLPTRSLKPPSLLNPEENSHLADY